MRTTGPRAGSGLSAAPECKESGLGQQTRRGLRTRDSAMTWPDELGAVLAELASELRSGALSRVTGLRTR